MDILQLCGVWLTRGPEGTTPDRVFRAGEQVRTYTPGEGGRTYRPMEQDRTLDVPNEIERT